MKKYNINTIEEFKLNAVGADVSVRLRKKQNRNNIRIFDKHKSNVVGETSLGDPKEKYKFANKPLSNIPTSNIKFPTSNSAITLIALIITIIVLLIFAGVTLNMVMGENGLFGKANNAKNKTEVAQYEEELRMCVLEMQTEEASSGRTFNMDTIRDNLDTYTQKLEDETIEWKEKDIEEPTGIQISMKILSEIPETGYTNQDVSLKIIITNNEKGINKIIKPDGNTESLNGAKTYEEEKTATENTKYTYVVTDTEGKEETKEVEIKIIDKNAPQDFSIEAQVTEEGIQITANPEDAEETETNASSGINKVEYILTNEKNETTTYETNLIKELSSGTYSVYTKANDKAGNEKQSTNTVTDLKVSASIKRTNISATDIKSNPEGYYGQTVDYTSENGQNDWKIFHSDGTNIYLITGDLVKVTDESGNIDTSKINANTKMQKADTTSDYCVNWNEKASPSFQTLSSDIISKFKIDTSVFDINGRKGNPNVQCVSTLLNSDNWTSYIDSRMGENQYAIGGPTIELWTDSWNSIKDKKLYCNNSNANGYYIGTTVFSKTESVELKSNINNTEKIYFVNSEKGIYWMASPSAHYQNNLMRVKSSGEIDYYRFSVEECAIRPVVCLTSNISLK